MTSALITSWHNAADLVGRVFMATFFIIFGAMKVTGYTGFVAYMEANNVPGFLLPLVILTEIGGGLLVLLGWHTRIVSFLLAGFALMAVLIFLPDLSQSSGQTIALAEVATAGGLLVLSAHGAAGWSLDARRQRK